MNKKVEKWYLDVLRTVKWLRAVVGMDHADVVVGKPHKLDPDAATAGDRMASWFEGAGAEPTNVQRFRDASAVLRLTPPEGWPAQPPAPVETASVVEPPPAPEPAPVELPPVEPPPAPVPDPPSQSRMLSCAGSRDEGREAEAQGPGAQDACEAGTSQGHRREPAWPFLASTLPGRDRIPGRAFVRGETP